MKAIETSYKGYRFRSRLEARWAVFLGSLDLQWEYEKQGFVLGPDRLPYLPDFWLPELRTWLEVKPGGVPLDPLELHLCESLCTESRSPVVILRGSPDLVEHPALYPVSRDEAWDAAQGDWYWGECPACGLIGLGFFGWRFADKSFCGCRESNGFLPVVYKWDSDRIQRAITAARSARFEFGETPK